MGIIGSLIIIALVIAAFKAIADTEKGGFVIIIMPLILILINFTIGWDNYWDGVPFPNPIDPGGFINDVIARIIGGCLDALIGVNFFRPVFSWILGMLFYSLILAGFQVSFYDIFLRNLDKDKSFVLFAVWLVFFTAFYYFHLLDNYFIFSWFSMPFKAGDDIKWYYWISIVLASYIIYDQHKDRY